MILIKITRVNILYDALKLLHFFLKCLIRFLISVSKTMNVYYKKVISVYNRYLYHTFIFVRRWSRWLYILFQLFFLKLNSLTVGESKSYIIRLAEEICLGKHIHCYIRITKTESAENKRMCVLLHSTLLSRWTVFANCQ